MDSMTENPAIMEVPQEAKKAVNDLFSEYMMIAELMRKNLPEPDFVIGDDYISRWWLAKIESEHDEEVYGPLRGHTRRTDEYSMYLHRMTGSDDDRALHDHPWTNTSLILQGEYIEHTPLGAFHRKPGDVVYREAEALHRLEMVDGPIWTLFLTGKKSREWGFMCPQGWRHWKIFTSYDETGDSSRIGRGCGEL